MIERACLFADRDLVTVGELALALPDRRAAPPATGRPVPGASPAARAGAAERAARALASTRGNKAAAARLLGISRRALYRRLGRLEAPAARQAAADELGR